MAMGGNLPYRRLCREYGAVRTCSEMILARKLVRGGERHLLRHHPEETDFGVQLVGKLPEEMAEAAVIAAEHGARFIDLNFGCPIDLIVKRGAGAALLRRPGKLAEIVAAVRAVTELPLSVKLRLGYTPKQLNCVKLAGLAAAAGADAIGIHGRTRSQRYRQSAEWTLLDEAARSLPSPVLGNGDLLTSWDLDRRLTETSVRSFLVARGALIKPWIFAEFADRQPRDPSAAGRWQVMRRYFELATEHFGDDQKGLDRIHRFFLWHMQFWIRWRPWTHGQYLAQLPNSLIQARAPEVSGDPEMILLASEDESDHEQIWQRVLDRDYPTG